MAQILSIQIIDNELRLVSLAKKLKGIKLLAQEQIPLPNPDQTSYEEVVINGINNFLKKNRLKAQRVVLALPLKEVIFRQIELPAVAKEELLQLLTYEIERHLPGSKKEVYFDFQLQEKHNNQQRIAIFATSRHLIDQQLALLDKSSINCNAVSVGGENLLPVLEMNNLLKRTDQGTFMVLNTDGEDVEIDLFQQRHLVTSCVVPKPQQDTITVETVAEQPNSEEEAAGGIEQPGTEEEARVAEEQAHPEEEAAGGVEQPGTEEEAGVAEEQAQPEEEEAAARAERPRLTEARDTPSFLLPMLARIMTSVGEKFDETSLEQIVLWGSEASHWASYLQDETGIKTSVLTPYSYLQTRLPNVAINGKMTFVTAIAIAELLAPGNYVNLLPPKRRPLKKKNALGFTIALSILITILAVVNLGMNFWQQQRKLNKISEQINQLAPEIVLVNKIKGECTQLQQQLATINNIEAANPPLLKLLKELTLIIPDDVWLDRLILEKGVLEISGYAASASALISILEESSLLDKVAFTSAITTKVKMKEKFKIKAHLQQKTLSKKKASGSK